MTPKQAEVMDRLAHANDIAKKIEEQSWCLSSAKRTFYALLLKGFIRMDCGIYEITDEGYQAYLDYGKKKGSK